MFDHVCVKVAFRRLVAVYSFSTFAMSLLSSAAFIICVMPCSILNFDSLRADNTSIHI